MGKKSCGILLFILLSVSSFAQEIEGIVIDDGTGVPLSGVIISSDGSSSPAITNLNGYFAIDENIQIPLVLQAYLPGYKKKQITLLRPQSGKIKTLIRLSPMIMELSEVRVSSRRDLLPVMFLDSKSIESATFPTLGSFLSGMPGLSLVKDSPWATAVSIRGIGGPRVITIIDNSRAETATDIAAVQGMIFPDDVENVEIIKGAASSVYGTGAMAGVLSINTKQASYSEKLTVNGSLSGSYSGRNDQKSSHMAFFIGSKRIRGSFSLGYTEAGNMKTPGGTIPGSQYSFNSQSASLGFRISGEDEVLVRYQKYYGSDIGLPGASSLFPQNAKVRYPEEERRLFSVNYAIPNIFGPVSHLDIHYYSQYIKRDVENLPSIAQIVPASAQSKAKLITTTSILPKADHNTNGASVEATLSILNNFVTKLGTDFFIRSYSGQRKKNQRIEVFSDDGSVSDSSTRTIVEVPIPESDYRDLGFYMLNEMAVVPKMKLSISGRYDIIAVSNEKSMVPLYEITNSVINFQPAGQKVQWNEKKFDDNSWSLSLGASYALMPSLDFALSLSGSFRAPSLEERFQYIDQGSVLKIGNPEIKSERGLSFEASARFYSEDLIIKFGLFLNEMTDLLMQKPGIYFDGTSERKALVMTNFGRSRILGYEMSFEAGLPWGLWGYGSFTGLRGQDLEGNFPLPGIAPPNGQTGLRGPILQLLNFNLCMTVFLRQDRIAPGEISTPGYSIFNLDFNSIPIDLSGKSLRLFFGMENLFNKAYRNHLSTNRGGFSLEPGRSLFIKAKLCF